MDKVIKNHRNIYHVQDFTYTVYLTMPKRIYSVGPGVPSSGDDKIILINTFNIYMTRALRVIHSIHGINSPLSIFKNTCTSDEGTGTGIFCGLQ